jgi:putative membrane protein
MENPSSQTGPRASLSDYLAAERTLLAWIRTGLAMMGFGFVVARFGLFLQEVQIAQAAPIRSYGFSLRFGIVLIALGVVVDVLAGWNHVRLMKRLDSGQQIGPIARNHAVIVAFALALIGIAMAAYLFSM